MNTSEEDKKISILYRFILVLFFYPIWSKESCNYIYIRSTQFLEEKLLD